jgi:L-threonylcarbamoyladenylate synthase
MKTKIIKSQSILSTLIASIALWFGRVIAIPTDTVYGIAVKANKAANIEKLYKIKAREHTKAIPVLIGDISQLPQVTPHVSPSLLKLAENFWPGPLTIIIPKHPGLPENISPTPTLGIRIPNHPAAINILKTVGPLAVTSANISGGADTNTAEEVMAQLDGLVDLIIDGGETESGVPSTVVDLTGKEIKILRTGSIELEEIQKALSI